ncbi:hypothetical protein BOTBODRAFT_114209, partial [Botryobasidium botryosum FD-172 SS1]
DETLRFFLLVRIPDLPSDELPSPSDWNARHPPLYLLHFLTHLQIGLEASYISPAPPPPPPLRLMPPPGRPRLITAQQPPNPNSNSLSLKLTAPSPSTMLAPIHPPHTPNPIPQTSEPDTQYARVDQGVVIYSYIWDESPIGKEPDSTAKKESANERRFALGWSESERLWVAVYELDVSVAYVQMRFPDPLLCLTASATLRDKSVASTSHKQVLSRYFPTAEVQNATSPAAKANGLDEDEIMEGFEEINLLGGLESDPTFASSESDTVPSLPSTRIGTAVRRQAFSLAPVQISTPHSSPTPHSSHSYTRGTPILRKSYRKTLATVSGIKVRMRNCIVPHLFSFDPLTDGAGTSTRTGLGGIDSEERDEDEIDGEDRTVVLCVEIENTPESGAGFLVENVELNIGGDDTKVRLIGWDNTISDFFPLKLQSSDQYNLLYALSFRHPSDAGIGTSGISEQDLEKRRSLGIGFRSELQRPVKIIVRGRPLNSNGGTGGVGNNTPSFTSRWNTILDLAATQHTGAYDRPTSPYSIHDALPTPASPFPFSQPRTAPVLPSEKAHAPFSNTNSNVNSGTNTPVAGSKRHTIAGLTSRRKGVTSLGVGGIGGTNTNISHRASTPAIAQSQPFLAPNAAGKFVPIPPSILAAPGSVLGSAAGMDVGSPPATISQWNIVPPTPAFPSYPDTQSPGTPFPQSPIHGFPGGMPSVNDPRTFHFGPDTHGYGYGYGYGQEENILVSVGLLPPIMSPGAGSSSGRKYGRIYPLDVFALEIFVFNKTGRLRRFEVSIPEKRKRLRGHGQARHLGGEGRDFDPRNHGYRRDLIPLENHIRIGPLLPETCESVRMQFIALEAGVHSVDMLTLTDVETRAKVNLRLVYSVGCCK